MARAQGALAIGPVTAGPDLTAAVARGVATVQAGGVCVIDVRLLPGYDAE